MLETDSAPSLLPQLESYDLSWNQTWPVKLATNGPSTHYEETMGVNDPRVADCSVHSEKKTKKKDINFSLTSRMWCR